MKSTKYFPIILLTFLTKFVFNCVVFKSCSFGLKKMSFSPRSSLKPIARLFTEVSLLQGRLGSSWSQEKPSKPSKRGRDTAPQRMAPSWPPASQWVQDHLNRAWDWRIRRPPGVQTDFKKLQLNGSSRDYRAILTIIKWFCVNEPSMPSHV